MSPSSKATEVVVAGHICLDIIPSLDGFRGRPADIFLPGRLVKVGKALISTGGAVPNTGLALHRLGVPVSLMGKLGDDMHGRAVLDMLRARAPHLADGMIVAPGEETSYTVVISPPDHDRTFLHCPGANDTFAACDLPKKFTQQARIFHFGYPPLMRGMYSDGGAELAAMLRQVRRQGLAVSLDMSLPDVASPAGQADWPTILSRALPHVDFYLPSLDETLLMLDRPAYLRLCEDAAQPAVADVALLRRLADELLRMGAAVVALKLGSRGLYLRTTSHKERLRDIGGRMSPSPAKWLNRELLAPCFQVQAIGTTGAGDSTIAGFLAALLHNLPPEETMRTAVAVGACSVEQADATSGVPSWTTLQRRLSAPWAQLPGAAPAAWRRDERHGLWKSPDDNPQ